MNETIDENAKHKTKFDVQNNIGKLRKETNDWNHQNSLIRTFWNDRRKLEWQKKIKKEQEKSDGRKLQKWKENPKKISLPVF